MIRAGQAALLVGDWVAARHAFEAALRDSETREALEGLALAAWWQDDAECVLESRERAYRLYRKAQDARGAARMAIALAGDFLGFRGEPAVAQGWQQRARQLLAELAPGPEHAWLELTKGDFALSLRADPEAALVCAEQALLSSRDLGIEDIRVVAHALRGGALVAQGQVKEGMAELDGAVAVALSGELDDPVAIGYSCCYMLHACERARDLERAAEWCAKVSAFSKRTRFDVLLAVCRAHHGSLLIGRGLWREAEAELEASARKLAVSRPGVLGEALLRLAGLRRRQGRFVEASDLLQQLAGDPAALVEQAALALDRGEPRSALALAERCLRRMPEHNRADRAFVLELIIQARVSLGDADAAAGVLALLEDAATNDAPMLVACLRRCEGIVARSKGDETSARRALEDAVDGFQRCGAPFEAARARLDLGAMLVDSGLTELARVEVLAALQCFERLGAKALRELAQRHWDQLVSTTDAAQAVVPKPGPAVAEPTLQRSKCHDASAAERTLSSREVEVLRLVARGLPNRTIAEQLSVSEFTVKRHVQNILTKLKLPTRAAAASHAARAGWL